MYFNDVLFIEGHRVILTGFNGGLERIKFSITAWASSFTVGGMSPLTCIEGERKNGGVKINAQTHAFLNSSFPIKTTLY